MDYWIFQVERPQIGAVRVANATGKPLYVGQSRNLRARLAQYCREGADHNSASLAYNIAKRTAAKEGIGIAGFRADLVGREDFAEQVLAAKRLVAMLPVQFVIEPHADLRTVFEAYATYALGTQEYNIFETH